MRGLLVLPMLLAIVFESQGQQGVTWFSRIGSLPGGRFRVQWRGVFPASSGIRLATSPKCSLLVEDGLVAAKGKKTIRLRPRCQVVVEPDLPGWVLVLSQEFDAIGRQCCPLVLRGKIIYQCLRDGRAAVYREQSFMVEKR